MLSYPFLRPFLHSVNVSFLLSQTRFPVVAPIKNIYPQLPENAEKFAAMGGLVAPGTDAGAWAVPQGCLTEYELLKTISPEILEQGIAGIREKF